jgi:hypothetical protein
VTPDCRRVPPSEPAPAWGADIVLAGRRFEVKAQTHRLGQLYAWLGAHFGLVVMVDREEPLVVLRLGDFLRNCRFREPSELGRPKTSGRVSGGSSRDRAV